MILLQDSDEHSNWKLSLLHHCTLTHDIFCDVFSAMPKSNHWASESIVTCKQKGKDLRIHHHLLYRTNKENIRDCNLTECHRLWHLSHSLKVPNHCQLSHFRNQIVKVTQKTHCDSNNIWIEYTAMQRTTMPKSWTSNVATFSTYIFWDVAFLKRCSISYNTQRDFSNKINSKTLQSMFFLLYSILYIIVKNFFIYFVYLQYCWYNFIEIVWYMMMIVANAT